MSDDRTKRGSQERGRVNLDRNQERRDWAKRLGVTKGELKEAMHVAGDSPDALRHNLSVKGFMERLKDYAKRRKARSRA